MQYSFSYIQLHGQKLAGRKASFNNPFLTSYGLPLFFTLIGKKSFASPQYERVIYLHSLVKNNCDYCTSLGLTFHKIRVYASGTGSYVFHAAIRLSMVIHNYKSSVCTFS